MIKRETIKKAIETISARDHEVGYTLDEMLGSGQIDAPASNSDGMLGEDFFFIFQGYKARVSKFLYINKGNVPIEERLLVKYGELVKKHELLEKKEAVEGAAAFREIRRAGLRFMVRHEIDYAAARLEKRPVEPGRRHLLSFFEALKADRRARIDPEECGTEILYTGTVDTSTPAVFVHYPYCLESLMQVADINIEFFHVRFLLNRLIDGNHKNLYTCLVGRQITGLIYLTYKERILHRDLEIKFVAAQRERPAVRSAFPSPPPHKGVGTFLAAGVWLEWKTGKKQARDIVLDSETGARHFYASIGFEPRGPAEFVLGAPCGFLLRAILKMADNCRSLEPKIVGEIERALEREIRSLAKRGWTAAARSRRVPGIACVKEALTARSHPEIAALAVRLLNELKKKIPEAEEALRFASAFGSWKEETPVSHE